MTYEEYEAAIMAMIRDLRATIAATAAKLNVPVTSLEVTAAERLRDNPKDGRSAMWCARLRLYDSSDGYREPVADTDAGADPRAPGRTQFRGLPALLPAINQFVMAYHGSPGAGLDAATLNRKLRSCRSQMATRGDGTGVLRAEYEVAHTSTYGGPQARHMIARVDISKPDEDTAGPSGLRPGLQLMADRAAAISANRSGAE